MAKKSDKTNRRRTCADLMRRNVAKRRRSDPASKAVLQLLSWLSVALALFPERAVASPLAERGNILPHDRRTPPPDYDLGSAAWARERGLEPNFYPARGPKPRPSWNCLINDLIRRSAKADLARTAIEERVPTEALEWLKDMIRREAWLALRLVGHNRSEAEIRDRAALESMRWKFERLAPAVPSSDDEGAAPPPVGPKPKF